MDNSEVLNLKNQIRVLTELNDTRKQIIDQYETVITTKDKMLELCDLQINNYEKQIRAYEEMVIIFKSKLGE